MYRNNQTLNQKGIQKVASVYDALSVSNRTALKTFKGTTDVTDGLLTDALNKIASEVTVNEEMSKEAGFSNGLEMFGNVRKMLSNKLGISEGAAQDMTSNVITRSEGIVREYGGDQSMVASNIIEEMKMQAATNPGILSGRGDMHPMTTHNGQIKEQIKQRFVAEMNMSQRDADMYSNLVLKQAQDLSTVLRPHKRDTIAMGIIDVVSSTKDLTSIYGFKDSPSLMSAIRIQLGG